MPAGRWSAVARHAIPLVLIGATLAAYAVSFRGAFLLDDLFRIIENPRIRYLWPPWQVMAGTSRPVVELSLAFNYALGDLDVWGYHAVNLTIHILAGLTLFGLVRRTLQSPTLRSRYGQAAPWLAMAVALLWLVHPLQTESVTYIIQRAESLMGLFYLLTLYCGMRGSGSPHPWAWYAGAVTVCALGMGSKEVMASAPIMMLLYDRVFLAGSFTEIFRRRWGLYAGLAATWLLLGTFLATSHPEAQVVLVTGLTPWRYLITQPGVIVHYLRLSVWPHPLILDYTWPLADGLLSVLPWAAVVMALLVGTAFALFRQAWIGFLGAWFFVILAPSSSLFPLADVAFEHRMYLPLVAVILLVVIGLHQALRFFVQRGRASAALCRGLEIGLLVVAVLALGVATIRRNESYRSELAMWRDVVRERPDNPRAHLSLGIALDKEGKTSEAMGHYREALRLKPDYPDAHNSLGAALYGQGKNDEAAAHFAEALRLRPQYAEALNNLASSLFRQGRANEAIARLEQALQVKPHYADAHYNLALALLARGDDQRAIVHFSEAVRLTPGSAEIYNNVGNALYRRGLVKEAIPRFSEAIRLKPGFAEAHHNLGLALLDQGDIPGAISHLSEAVRLKPDYAKAHNNLGTLLYRQRRIKEAIAHFSEAVRLNPDFTEARDNLRRAQAGQQ